MNVEVRSFATVENPEELAELELAVADLLVRLGHGNVEGAETLTSMIVVLPLEQVGTVEDWVRTVSAGAYKILIPAVKTESIEI